MARKTLKPVGYVEQVAAPYVGWIAFVDRYPSGRKLPHRRVLVDTTDPKRPCPFASRLAALDALNEFTRGERVAHVALADMVMAKAAPPPTKKVYTLGIEGRSADEVAEAKAHAARLARRKREREREALPVTPVTGEHKSVALPEAPCPKEPLPISNERRLAYRIARLNEKRAAGKTRKVKARGTHNPITLGRGPLPGYLLDDYADIDPRVIALIR